uniref:Secreted peptide n=1 Tax=Rhipicephalus pulchellus TaxID=72859 RepID=L7M9L5_RHIPC
MAKAPSFTILFFLAAYAFLLAVTQNEGQSCANATPTRRPPQAPPGCRGPRCFARIRNIFRGRTGPAQQPRLGQHTSQGQQPTVNRGLVRRTSSGSSSGPSTRSTSLSSTGSSTGSPDGPSVDAFRRQGSSSRSPPPSPPGRPGAVTGGNQQNGAQRTMH